MQEDIRNVFFLQKRYLFIYIHITKQFFSIKILKEVYEFPFRWKTQLAP